MPEIGGPVARRPLHFVFIVDTSGSMNADGKIQALNNAIKEAIPHMRIVAEENPFAELLVRAISFSSGARWTIPTPTLVDQFQWSNLTADGTTDMGLAIEMLADQLRIPPMTERALPPVLVLISDGQPTDDFATGMSRLLSERWGQKSVRISIAIGQDADLEVLRSFMSDTEMAPLQANNPEQLVRLIKWASTAVVQASMAPPSQGAAPVDSGGNVPIPQLAAGDTSEADDVW